jgi:hypothetical protein
MPKSLLFAALALVVACPAAHSQGRRHRPEAATRRATPSASAPLVFLDSTRERDGLKGPVRRVETEVIKVRVEQGKAVEAARLVLERTLYDEGGRRVENETFPVVGSPAGEEVHRYDARGNLAETIVRDAHGATLSRRIYEYVFDEFGNWVKQTASVAVVNAGAAGFEPVEITNRRITYYQTGEVVGAKTSGAAVVEDDSVPTTNEERRGAHADAETTRPTPHATGESRRPTPPVVAENRRTTARAEAEGSCTAAHVKGREINVGTLNDRATSLPKPAFPITGKRLEEPITVSVEVVVDQTGRVAEAKAQNGPPALREAAEVAARRATFFPFYEEGRPVRARGWLNFGFLFAP